MPETATDSGFDRRYEYSVSTHPAVLDGFVSMFRKEISDREKSSVLSCLMQAYHHFNEDCTGEEAAWIRAYCRRHGIRTDRFRFDRGQDRLF